MKASPVMYVEDYEYTDDTEYTYNHRTDFNGGQISIDLIELNSEVDALLNDLPKRCREIYTMSRKENLTSIEPSQK